MSNHFRLPLLALLCCLFSLPSFAVDRDPVDAPLQALSGETMGTTYTVKVFDGPQLGSDLKFAIDAELRKVNDQMSTYLKSSEISRFNDSQSTEWFPVSSDTATVVSFAQQLSKTTRGAFDVTVGPLVNVWSFGPDPKTGRVPSDADLTVIRQSIGYQKLNVRLDPPAIRKSVPDLEIDLSAIAKGHGVDRIVELLNRKGAENVFVEIGGEVRTTGSKGGDPWKVGIQMPDAAKDAVMIAHAMDAAGKSMATSGDYRIFFEVDGKRYSHTIDPRTGKPVEHDLASVTVVADSCMKADAWATAINVLGGKDGLKLAEQESIDVLLVNRTDDGYTLSAAGSLAKYVATASQAAANAAAAPSEGNAVPVMILAFGVFAVLIGAMAIGVMLGRKPIAGSCGGLNNPPNEDGSVSCSMCSNPADACKELREKMERGKGP